MSEVCCKLELVITISDELSLISAAGATLVVVPVLLVMLSLVEVVLQSADDLIFVVIEFSLNAEWFELRFFCELPLLGVSKHPRPSVSLLAGVS